MARKLELDATLCAASRHHCPAPSTTRAPQQSTCLDNARNVGLQRDKPATASAIARRRALLSYGFLIRVRSRIHSGRSRVLTAMRPAVGDRSQPGRIGLGELAALPQGRALERLEGA